MENVKKYYWLKLKEDFFDDKVIKYLRQLPEGPTLVIIYLKMQLKSLKTEGFLKYDGILPTCEEELALVLDEKPMLVAGAINALEKLGVVERWNNDVLYMKAMQELIGTETASAARVRKHREMKRAQDERLNPLRLPAKTNAERQRAFRAKKACEEVQHIPLVDDGTNNARYGGNYYLVMKRDKYRCTMCNSIENICVHHIDGFYEDNPENNAENKMLVLCRSCHRNVHLGNTKIPQEILESIDYFVESNGSNEECNAQALPKCVTVTSCNTEIEIDIRDREDLDKDLDILPGVKKTPSRKPKEIIPSEPAVITLTLNDKSLFPVTETDIRNWQELYPAVNVLQELRNMKGWLDSNPAKRKTKAGIRRFINGWLSREQDKYHPDAMPVPVQSGYQQPQQQAPRTFRDMLREAEGNL